MRNLIILSLILSSVYAAEVQMRWKVKTDFQTEKVFIESLGDGKFIKEGCNESICKAYRYKYLPIDLPRQKDFSMFGSVNSKLCVLAGGVAQQIQIFEKGNWNPHGRCLFQDGSFISLNALRLIR